MTKLIALTIYRVEDSFPNICNINDFLRKYLVKSIDEVNRDKLEFEHKEILLDQEFEDTVEKEGLRFAINKFRNKILS